MCTWYYHQKNVERKKCFLFFTRNDQKKKLLLIIKFVASSFAYTRSENRKKNNFQLLSSLLSFILIFIFFSLPFWLCILIPLIVTAVSSNCLVFRNAFLYCVFSAVYWECGRMKNGKNLSLKSTHTTLLDDFHRYSECVADGGKQLRSRHHTKQMTRSPELTRTEHEVIHVYFIQYIVVFFFFTRVSVFSM